MNSEILNIQQRIKSLSDELSLMTGMPVKVLVLVEQNEEFLLELVETVYQVKREEIFSKSRKARIVLARQAYIFILHEYFNYSCTTLSRMFKCDHSTIIHSYQTTMDRLDVNDRSVDKLKQILSILSELVLQ